MKSSLLVFVGAGLGGLARHFLNLWVTAAANSSFPYGILTINILGSTAMGLVAGWLAFRSAGAPELRLFLATGILGGFTTFSAFSLDAVLLMERNDWMPALLYVVGSVVLSLLAFFAVMRLVRVLFA